MKRYGKNDMIKFILLLPLKIIGVIFLEIGAFLDRREKERIAAAREYEKRIAAAQKEEEQRERAARIATERAQRLAKQEQREKERREKEQAARTAMEQKKQREKEQAGKDIERYKDLLKQSVKLYGMLHSEYEQATENKNSKKAIVTYRQMIAADKTSREIERKIEQAKQILRAG